MVFFKDSVHCLSHDEDLVDLHAIDAEVNREVEEELDAMYPHESPAVEQ